MWKTIKVLKLYCVSTTTSVLKKKSEEEEHCVSSACANHATQDNNQDVTYSSTRVDTLGERIRGAEQKTDATVERESDRTGFN